MNSKTKFFLKGLLVGIIVAVLSVSYFISSSVSNIGHGESYISANPTIGAPSYTGTCPDVITNLNFALLQNQYLIHHLSNDKTENMNFYKKNIASYIKIAYKFAAECSDVEATGRLLVATAHINLDLAFDKIIPYAEAVKLAANYYQQAETIGYTKTHPTESMFLFNRIERNALRAKIKADV